ncbi:hypothetical protein Hamer_G004416 [Homarus americanus]|uniref:Uncharacterized protein n=1 Tax=Homarus americanus TaxID=6706 RepID=A0A8J5MTT7_HOMAM|nr:hypothetical protein Hamer_G004416 [Homarus americanus]
MRPSQYKQNITWKNLHRISTDFFTCAVLTCVTLRVSNGSSEKKTKNGNNRLTISTSSLDTECEESVSVQLKKRDCPAGSVWQSELQSCVDPKTGEVVSDSSGSRVSSGSKQNNQENEPASPTVEDIKEQKKKCKANGGFWNDNISACFDI